MPKKLQVNSKSQEARERKDFAKKAEKSKKEKESEDAKWVDEGSTATEKRKAETEAKRLADQAKRDAKKALLAAEESELAKVKQAKSAKITQRQIALAAEEADRSRSEAEEVEKMRQKNLVHQPELTENVNQTMKALQLEEEKKYGKGGVISASGLNAALQATGAGVGDSVGSVEVDQHPEKRLKAAFKAYSERELPILRKENPGLRLSQLREILWKMWLKAPENPINSAAASAAAKLEAETAERSQLESDEEDD